MFRKSFPPKYQQNFMSKTKLMAKTGYINTQNIQYPQITHYYQSNTIRGTGHQFLGNSSDYNGLQEQDIFASYSIFY